VANAHAPARPRATTHARLDADLALADFHR
jgi:hypothetical protein